MLDAVLPSVRLDQRLHGGCGSEVTESPCFPSSQGSKDFMQKKLRIREMHTEPQKHQNQALKHKDNFRIGA